VPAAANGRLTTLQLKKWLARLITAKAEMMTESRGASNERQTDQYVKGTKKLWKRIGVVKNQPIVIRRCA
jgi:hypothetical protein